MGARYQRAQNVHCNLEISLESANTRESVRKVTIILVGRDFFCAQSVEHTTGPAESG